MEFLYFLVTFLFFVWKKSSNSKELSVPDIQGHDLQGIKIFLKIFSLTTYHGAWNPYSYDFYEPFNARHKSISRDTEI